MLRAIALVRARFARLMKGRLWFYLNAPQRFETDWLIRNDLGRIGQSFFRTPFGKYWQLKTDQTVANPVEILTRLDFLNSAEIDAARRFDEVTSNLETVGSPRLAAAAVIEIYDDFLRALTKLVKAV